MFSIAVLETNILPVRQTKISFIDFNAPATDIEEDLAGTNPEMFDIKPIDISPGNINPEKDFLEKDTFFDISKFDNNLNSIEIRENQEVIEEKKDNLASQIVCKRKVLRLYYPKYPTWAKKMGLESEIKVKFQISNQGTVKNIYFEKMSGYPALDILGIRAIKKWKFEPSRENLEKGEWGTVTLKFSIN